MAREIKFRGLHIHATTANEYLDGTWIYGYLCGGGHYIEPEYGIEKLIDCDTVGQYTGITDKKGKEIYEGDVIAFEDVGEEGYEYKEGFDFINRAFVVWNNGRFEIDRILSDNSMVLEEMNDCHEDFWNVLKSCVVIGNIYNTPELLVSQN